MYCFVILVEFRKNIIRNHVYLSLYFLLYFTGALKISIKISWQKVLMVTLDGEDVEKTNLFTKRKDKITGELKVTSKMFCHIDINVNGVSEWCPVSYMDQLKFN